MPAGRPLTDTVPTVALHHVQAQVPDGQFRILKLVSRRYYVPVSALVRQALTEYLARQYPLEVEEVNSALAASSPSPPPADPAPRTAT